MKSSHLILIILALLSPIEIFARSHECSDELQKFRDAIEGRVTVLTFGDVMIDEDTIADTVGVSSEGPTVILQHNETKQSLGGASNMALNLKTLGVSVKLSGVVGENDSDDFRELLTTNGFSDNGIFGDPSRPTTTKNRLWAKQNGKPQQVLRVDYEKKHPISSEIEDRAFRWLTQQKRLPSAIVLSDYNKGFLTPALSQKIIQWAAQREIPVIVDPKGKDYSKYSGATLIKPNKSEASEITGIKITDEKTAITAAKIIISKFNVQNVIITLSEKGMVLVSRDGSVINIPTIAKEQHEPTGAGDTVAAVIAAGLAANQSLELSARIANAAAGVTVSHNGVYAVKWEDLERELSSSSDAKDKSPESQLVPR